VTTTKETGVPWKACESVADDVGLPLEPCGAPANALRLLVTRSGHSTTSMRHVCAWHAQRKTQPLLWEGPPSWPFPATIPAYSPVTELPAAELPPGERCRAASPRYASVGRETVQCPGSAVGIRVLTFRGRRLREPLPVCPSHALAATADVWVAEGAEIPPREGEPPAGRPLGPDALGVDREEFLRVVRQDAERVAHALGMAAIGQATTALVPKRPRTPCASRIMVVAPGRSAARALRLFDAAEDVSEWIAELNERRAPFGPDEADALGGAELWAIGAQPGEERVVKLKHDHLAARLVAVRRAP
jgi:hypothetical protein